MRRYRSLVADNARWEGFEFRDDDILICTPAKSGTTWMQNIVAMLVLGTTELDAPLGTFSPWLDMQTRTVADARAMLDAQTHRRFIKTHTPLDGLPARDEVTYLTCTRHPLEVVGSWRDHIANLDIDRMLEIRAATVGLDDLAELAPPPERSEDPEESFRQWVTDDADYAGAGGASSLKELVHHIRTFWDRRHLPNVHLFHFADLLGDLDAEMRRVAEVLEVELPPDWDRYVEAAGFGSMRSRADVLAPDSQMDGWRSNEAFFRAGDARRFDIADADRALFERRLVELAGPDLAAWITTGRRSATMSS